VGVAAITDVSGALRSLIAVILRLSSLFAYFFIEASNLNAAFISVLMSQPGLAMHTRVAAAASSSISGEIMISSVGEAKSDMYSKL
jgi:hypothetical protein